MSNKLVYEQDEVYTHPVSHDELPVRGRLQIIETNRGVNIEWNCSDDENSGSDNDWAVVNTAAVTYTHHNITDSVEVSTSRKHVHSFFIEVGELRSYQIGRDGSLTFNQKDGTRHRTIYFHSGAVQYFEEVLSRYVTVKQSEKDSTLYLISNEKVSAVDEELSAMQLVPERRIQKTGVQYLAEAPHRVWGFLNNMKKDPYGTTVHTFSKFYDIILYDEELIRDSHGISDMSFTELFNNLSGSEDLEPGYALLTKKVQLVERPVVRRESPLMIGEFHQYTDIDGRVLDTNELKKKIFSGGLHPTLRRDLWCYLLGHIDWNATYNQREKKRLERENYYFLMKQQWKTVTADQESRFSGFRERKSSVEKDVKRTDRNHPFYEKENNPNVELLHDILMTYVMYNFDLGYVQGMSDLVAPILYVTQNEADAFWCFVGFMDLVVHNFDMDQSGMKTQLKNLQTLMSIVLPEFLSYLEAKESSNLYFCFRWILVWFKRELNYTDTLRLWEILWTGYPCDNFVLLVAAAVLDEESNIIKENNFGFTEILKEKESSEALYESEAYGLVEAVQNVLGFAVRTLSGDSEFDGVEVHSEESKEKTYENSLSHSYF